MKKIDIIIAVSIFIFSFFLFYYFRAPVSYISWDGLAYVTAIIEHKPMEALFGRLGYVLLNIPIWEFAHRLFHIPLSQAHTVIVNTTIFMSACFIVSFFLFSRLFLERNISLIATIFLMGAPSVILHAGETLTELPMLLFIFIGLILTYTGLARMRSGRFLWGAILPGIAFNIKEQAFVFLPAYLLLPFIKM